MPRTVLLPSVEVLGEVFKASEFRHDLIKHAGLSAALGPAYDLLHIHELIHTQNCLTKIHYGLIHIRLLLQELHAGR